MVYFRPALDGRMDGDGNSKLMIYNLERAIRLMPRHSWQYTIVIDCEGNERAKGDARRAGYVDVAALFREHCCIVSRVCCVW